MQLDRFMPHCDFYERHETLVRATPARVYEACRTADLASNPIVKLLLAMRGMRRDGTKFPPSGFHLLADDPPHEVVLGLEGPFWKPTCSLRDVNAETFRGPVQGNAARAAWNFLIQAEGSVTRLSTETRVLCSDQARMKFRMYWLFIRPFSGLIRRLMLRSIRKQAESP